MRRPNSCQRRSLFPFYFDPLPLTGTGICSYHEGFKSEWSAEFQPPAFWHRPQKEVSSYPSPRGARFGGSRPNQPAQAGPYSPQRDCGVRTGWFLLRLEAKPTFTSVNRMRSVDSATTPTATGCSVKRWLCQICQTQVARNSEEL